MSQCLNCNTKLSCGCQKRLASDGKYVCSKCIISYEDSLKEKNKNSSSKISSPSNLNK